jgi:hypothetical protein
MHQHVDGLFDRTENRLEDQQEVPKEGVGLVRRWQVLQVAADGSVGDGAVGRRRVWSRQVRE